MNFSDFRFLRIAQVMMVAALLGILFSLLVVATVRGDEPEPSPPVAAVTPAGPDMFSPASPVMYFGVHVCGAYVIWLSYEDGKMRRIDPVHKPLDMKEFMTSLENSKIPGDVISLPCTEGSL
jgi:hypothetical protein